MATRDENLATVRRVREELTTLLDGMDYCLDWKAGDNWCAREVLYHLVDTPEGGIGSVIAGVLNGSLPEVTILPDISNMTPERMAAEIDDALAGPLSILQTAEDAIANAADARLRGTHRPGPPAPPGDPRNAPRPVLHRRPGAALGRTLGATAGNTGGAGYVGVVR